MKNRIRNLAICLSLGLIGLVGSNTLWSAQAEVDTAPLSAIRTTPPAPVFDQAKRLEELASRRKRVAETIGSKAILVLFSAEPRVYTNDVDHPFRQENNLYYLTNLNQTRATLVLMPGNSVTPEILFVPRRNAMAETWTGHMYSPEEVAQLSGIKEIWDASEFDNFVKAIRNRESYRPKAANILMSERSDSSAAAGSNTGFESLFAAMTNNEAGLYLLNFPREGESKEYRQEQLFAATWRDAALKIQNASPIFGQMRVYKSPMELDLLQHAIDISIEAHQRAQAFASQAKWEYEVDAQVAYTFKLRNADNWGYPDIVGCGPNATTLHYE
jgi:Xaa-Pro aminopeptidase